MSPSVPLWLVFTLQSLIVAGAFIAVILVLVIQQQDQYKASVFREIDQQLHLAEAALVGPILTREKMFKQVVDRLVADSSIRMHADDTISDANIQRFFNTTIFNMFSDPLAYTFFQQRMHPTKRLSASSANGELYFGVAALTNENLALVSDYDGNVTFAYNPSFPLQFTSTGLSPLEASNLDWSLIARNNIRGGEWMRPGVFVNTVTGNVQLTTTLTYPIEIDTSLGVATLCLGYAVVSKYLVDLAKESLLTTNSKGLLVERILPTDNFIIAGMNTDAPDYDATAEALYTTSNFPNQGLVTQYIATEARCPTASNCTFFAEDDGENVMSLIFMNTDYSYRLNLFQVTPRSHYFADSERSTAVGISIGVIAALLVIVTCVVIWFSVRKPVQRLRESMDLAAMMRNDEVGDTSSVLTELNLLSKSFMQMNGKLLQARAFMPQSMLYAEDGIEDEEDNDVALVDEEGHLDDGSSKASSIARGRSKSVDIHSKNSSPAVMSRTDSRNQHSSFRDKGGSSRGSSVNNRCNIHTTLGMDLKQLLVRKVSVLVLNTRGTHELAASSGPTRLAREQVRLVELVERCTAVEKGVVDAFQGDHFILTFNAARAVGAPGRNAALTALSIEEAAHREALVLGQFSMGISVGRAQVGNIGSATMKKNCTVGPVFTNAIALERLAKITNHNCVVNGRCMGEIELVAYSLMLGSVALPADKADDTLWAVMYKVDSGLSSSNTAGGGGDEWLYEVDTASKGNPYLAYNDTIAKYIKGGSVEECLPNLKEIQTQSLAAGNDRLLDAATWMLSRLEGKEGCCLGGGGGDTTVKGDEDVIATNNSDNASGIRSPSTHFSMP